MPERINPRPRRVFYDFEFYEDGRTIEPISIGLCVEGSTEAFYGVNADAPWGEIVRHPWLVDNVLPHLPGVLESAPVSGHARFHPDWSNEHVYERSHLADRVSSFLLDQASQAKLEDGDDRPVNWTDLELWAYYAAYDHIALCQLIGGRMIDLPPFIPMYTNDLRELGDMVGLRGVALDQIVPQDPARAHDALADAMWNAAMFAELAARLAQLTTKERPLFPGLSDL